jgi:hypothetical protein
MRKRCNSYFNEALAAVLSLVTLFAGLLVAGALVASYRTKA